jgi:2-keto-4-pentenoate hydratase/2-oxohepta-3-ene-1,7-dioic acid hydratase in catechol pathway
MRLFRFGDVDQEKPGVMLPAGKRIDVSAFCQDFNEQFFATDGIPMLENWLTDHFGECPAVEESIRLGPCIARPSKIICIGLNYARHAAESGLDIPKEPIVFFKSTTALTGPNDDIVIPKNSQKTDWEVELAVVIGRRASYVSKEEADEYIAGYTLHNDYSEREFQLERGGQWVKGKSCDTFAPLGPFLATRDEIPDPHNLRLWLMVNGETLQDANTSDFIFDIPTLVSYLSQFMTLLPGDVISTGTPAGVGLGLKPPRFLKGGDVVTLGIEGLGRSTQRAVTYQKS